MNVKKLLGLLFFLAVVYALLLFSSPGARDWNNHFNLLTRIGLSGVVSLGVGILIISGGIDLSIGAVVGLCTTLLAMLLTDPKFEMFESVGAQVTASFAIVLGTGVLIGLINGLLVTKLKLQAFVVTLCGLFLYRGAARWISGDGTKGLGSSLPDLRHYLYSSKDLVIPISLVILLVLAGLVAVFLHASVYGRRLFAIGSNEQAARYSGIATDRYKILAYVLCSTFAAIYSVLYLMQHASAQPSSTGTFLELYAIAGAVLGGCSLRGGEGNVIGILLGTTILYILPNLTKMWGISSQLEPTVIGGALLLAAIADEMIRRRNAPRAGH